MKSVTITSALLLLVTFAYAADNTTIPPAPLNGLIIPDRVIARALLADLSNDTPVGLQWNQRSAMFTYAWDFINNSYSEEWRTNTTLIF